MGSFPKNVIDPQNVKKKERILHVANEPVPFVFSLPTDVLWGSFITHSNPKGRLRGGYFVLLSDRFTVSYFHYYSEIPGLAFLYNYRVFLFRVFIYFLLVNCWPSENDGQCDVNIEYELLQENLQLNDVVISIPVP